MSELIVLLQALNAAVTAGINVSAAVQRFEAMRAESGGHLTDEQIMLLAEAARQSHERM